MCTPAAIATVQGGQTASGIIGQATQGKLNEIQLQTQAAIEAANARLLEGKKKEISRSARLSEQRIMSNAAQTESSAIAAMGASGVSLASPTFQKLLSATDLNEAIDISLIRESESNQIAGVDLAINQKQNIAQGFEAQARQTKRNTSRGIFVNTLQGASSVGQNYFTNNALFQDYNLKKGKE